MPWVINGDITKCFDSIPHDLIMKQVGTRVSCARLLLLVERSLKAGYLNEQGTHVKAVVGTPQGSILSPLLSNIVLDLLDKYMDSLYKELNFGSKRKLNLKYTALENRRKYYKLRDPAIARQALLDMRRLTKFDMFDGGFRRALYIRYADDFVVLMASTQAQAMELKEKITRFLQEKCGLDLNQEKTTITNTRDGFRFLGAYIKRRTNVSLFNSFTGRKGNKITRRTTPRLGVDVDIRGILDKLVANDFARRNHLGTLLAQGKTSMVHLTHYDIVRFYNSKITGLLSAFSFAGNFSSMNKVC